MIRVALRVFGHSSFLRFGTSAATVISICLVRSCCWMSPRPAWTRGREEAHGTSSNYTAAAARLFLLHILWTRVCRHACVHVRERACTARVCMCAWYTMCMHTCACIHMMHTHTCRAFMYTWYDTCRAFMHTCRAFMQHTCDWCTEYICTCISIYVHAYYTHIHVTAHVT